MTTASDDPLLWLEQVDDPQALQWVSEMNAVTADRIQVIPGFASLRARLQSIYEADDRLVVPNIVGDYVYNFRQSASQVRGVVRRCNWADYRNGNEQWETLIDIDALARDAQEDWVYKGSIFAPSPHDRVLILLSRGGGDAVVVREFDLLERTFVADGFVLPEAKSQVEWLDRDSVLVCTDLGADSLTESGYPRTVYRWLRGTDISTAECLFTAPHDHVSAAAWVWRGQGHQLVSCITAPDFHTNEMSLLMNDTLVPIEKQDSAQVTFFADQLILGLREAWTLGPVTYPAGSLLAFDREAYLSGRREPNLLFEPDERGALEDIICTSSHLILKVLDSLDCQFHVWSCDKGRWQREAINDRGSVTVNAWAVDADVSEQWLMLEESYVQPPQLILADGSGRHTNLRSGPVYFQAEGLRITRGEAVSADGTSIPFTRVARGDVAGPVPTILYGYGGFEVTIEPRYDAALGAGWLEQGGAYVLAHIRGGGEFGPSWHQSALKHNRQRAFDDFIAVGERLIAADLCTAGGLAIQGGSNGGALVGAVYTQRPDLWTAAVCQVPLLDMLRFHLLPPGASWIGEFGDPDDAQDRQVLASWSPYHNLREDVEYPPMLLATSTRDDRVHPGHARKFAARLQELGGPVDYHERIDGGHGGAADRRAAAEMQALIYTWLHIQIGNEQALT